MTDQEKLRNEVKLEIQALLCTEKTAIPSKRLFGLYISEMGTAIPYAKLGYNQMDDFLRSIPDVVSSYTNYQDGMLYVKAVPLEGSSHINELVQGQRSAKKKKPNSNFSMSSRFKSFRVSSQVAPNRNFNRNYNSNFNTYKPTERFDNTRSGNFTRPPLYSSHVPFQNNLPPRFVKLNNQAPLSVTVTQKPNFPPSSNYSQRVLTTTGPSMFSNNYNINNNKTLTQPNAVMEPKPFAVPLNLNVTPANKPQGVPGRAHMTPQLMLPRTPAPQVQSDIPATPVLIQTSNVQPTPQIIQKPSEPSAFVDSIQNSLNDLKISSSKPVDPINPFEQDSVTQMKHLLKPLSPIKICEKKPVSPNAFPWKPMTPHPFQEAATYSFYPSGFEQRKFASNRRVVIKQEEERPRLPEVVAETLKTTRQLPEMVKEEVPVAPTQIISAAARAPRVLLRNGVPVVNPPVPLQTPRPFMYLPDRLPAEAPKQTPPVSPLLSRRLPHQPVESQPISRTITKDLTSKPTAVLSPRPGEFYCERLKKMVTKYQLGRVTLSHNQLKSGRFIASIKVGQEIFMTYPEDFEIMTDAYENAAKQAVEHFERTVIPVWMKPA